jgi:hypothetical protein
MNNQSIKHHFVPQFYQRGFAADNGDLFALKKKHGSIKSWKTSQILYEKGLHTIAFKQEKAAVIEEFYSGIEGQFSNYLKFFRANIRSPKVIDELFEVEEFIKIMKVVVSFQFWRTPNKKKLALQFSSELVNRYDRSSNEIKEMLGYDRRFIKYLMKRASKDDSIKIIQFLLLPLLTFDLSSQKKNIKFFTSSSKLSFFSSDEPVIYDNLEKLFNFESVWFPLSKELFLLASERGLNSIDINSINKVILDRADNVVICSSKEQLEQMKCNK